MSGPDPSSSHLEDARLLTVILKPFRLETTLRALAPFRIDEITIDEVRGYGRQKGHAELYRGAEYIIAFVPKIRLEFVVPTAELDDVIEAISKAARTGRIGDGKVFINSGVVVIEDG